MSVLAKLRECTAEPAFSVIVSSTLLTDAADEIAGLRTALADAIRRPMGVVPDSAEGLLSEGDLDLAEAKRTTPKGD